MHLKKYIKGASFYILLLTVIFLIYFFLNYQSGPVVKEFSDLVTLINNGTVKELVIVENTATATLNDNTKITSEIPSLGALYEHSGDQIKKQVSDKTLTLSTPQPASPPWWLSMLPSLILMIIIIVFWVAFFRQSVRKQSPMTFLAKTVLPAPMKVIFIDDNLSYLTL